MATPTFRYRTLALSIGLLCGSVQADTAGQTDEEVTVQGNTEHVTVIGQAARLDKALKEQRRSDSISNVVSADGVAQLPDANAAEALQRVPGVTVERDQGEGRYVTVRGLGAGLNAVSINGSLLPSPEGDTRAVAMDVLPSELVQSMSVVKTLTPDMDANSLGGTIEVRSLSAFDHEDAFNTFSVSGSHDDNTGEISPKLSGALTRKFSICDGTDNFGVALAASWEDRDFGSDNVETDGGWVVLMELAGVAKDAVSVRLDGARLTIRGEKPAHRDGRTQVAERDVGAFTREFLIPYQVDAERIVARLEDGLLRVTLPRLGEGSGRDVEVQG